MQVSNDKKPVKTSFHIFFGTKLSYFQKKDDAEKGLGVTNGYDEMRFPALMSGHCPQRDGWKAEKKCGDFIPRVSYTHLYSFPRLTLSSGNPSAYLLTSRNTVLPIH